MGWPPHFHRNFELVHLLRGEVEMTVGSAQELLHSGAAVVILAVNLADAFTLADRLVRVRRGASCEVYERSEFDRLPFSAPWLNLYTTP